MNKRTIVDRVLSPQHPNLFGPVDYAITDSAPRDSNLLSSLEGDLEDLTDFCFTCDTLCDRWRQMLTERRLDIIDELVDNVVIHDSDSPRFRHPGHGRVDRHIERDDVAACCGRMFNVELTDRPNLGAKHIGVDFVVANGCH